jgi:hypothetical protein
MFKIKKFIMGIVLVYLSYDPREEEKLNNVKNYYYNYFKTIIIT